MIQKYMFKTSVPQYMVRMSMSVDHDQWLICQILYCCAYIVYSICSINKASLFFSYNKKRIG